MKSRTGGKVVGRWYEETVNDRRRGNFGVN